ncbi:MAG: hypothetical protein PHV34_14900 [Verrucomicrobiae bacterium]|nr:hypothetical protein [Verrucomicrobiae bacterium]
MKIRKSANKGARVETLRYVLEFRTGEPLARLEVKRSHQRHLFYPGGACNPVGKCDETRAFGKLSTRQSPGVCEILIPESSSVWRRKTHRYVCREDSIEFSYTVSGQGRVDRAHFFRGYLRGAEHGFAGEFDEIYSTCPNFQERRYHHPVESFSISFGNDLTPSVGCQALASPCPCMGLRDRRDSVFMVAGLAAEPGQYTWDAFEWNPPVAIPPTVYAPDSMFAGGFAAVFAGKLRVNGEWRSPRLIMAFANGQKRVLPVYLNHCYRHGYLTKPRRVKPAAWWREPIYCTWHDQTALALGAAMNYESRKNAPKAGDFCTQKRAEGWVRTLVRHGCKPGIVILDDAWQKHLNTADPDTKKWPDLRGWIEKCHARGMRVFLWTAAWSPAGLPRDECITRNGVPIAGDMTCSKYEKRFREMARRWFSSGPDGLNADGIKVDGLLAMPTGPGLENHGNLWGLELQRKYLSVLYEEAKRCRRDICVSTYAANPYLAPFSDMVRIADMYTCRLTAHETMLHRAEVFRQTMPHAVIDTDGQLAHYMLDDYADELAEQARVGVPTLYNAEWVRRHRFFLPARLHRLRSADYAKFARVFRCCAGSSAR